MIQDLIYLLFMLVIFLIHLPFIIFCNMLHIHKSTQIIKLVNLPLPRWIKSGFIHNFYIISLKDRIFHIYVLVSHEYPYISVYREVTKVVYSNHYDIQETANIIHHLILNVSFLMGEDCNYMVHNLVQDQHQYHLSSNLITFHLKNL